MGQGIGNTQRRVDVPVAYGIVRTTLLQVRLHHVVVLSGSTLRNFVVGDIRNLAEQTRHLVLSIVHLLLQLLVRLLHLRNLSLDGFSLVFLSFLHQTTNLCCHLLGITQILVQLLLGLTTLLVDSQYFVNSLTGTLEMFLLQSANHAVSLLSNEFQCKHNYLVF